MKLKDDQAIIDEKNEGTDPVRKATEDQIVYDHTTGLDHLPSPIQVTPPLRDKHTEKSEFPYRR